MGRDGCTARRLIYDKACCSVTSRQVRWAYRSVTHRGTVITEMSASVYKSSPPGRKTGCSDICRRAPYTQLLSCRPSGSCRTSIHSWCWIDYSVSASGGNVLEQSLILRGPFAEQSDGFGELVAGWREAVVNMRRDNWMNQSVEQSAFLQLP
jgi:hypothetical protein